MKTTFRQLAPAKRQKIEASASAEFGNHDFDAASLDHIVAAAGISKGGLYEYISSKEDLYLHCVELAWSGLYAHIKLALQTSGEPLPGDVLSRFLTVSGVAIDWYLANLDQLGLIVRISRLPRDGLADQAAVIFEHHFSALFSGLDAGTLAYPLEQVIDLIKWLLAKTRKDVLLEIAAGGKAEAVREAYLAEWQFFCSVLARGIYQP